MDELKQLMIGLTQKVTKIEGAEGRIVKKNDKMKNELSNRVSAIETKVGEVAREVTSLASKAESTAREVADLRAKVDENDSNLPHLVNAAVRDYFANTGAPIGKRPRHFSRPQVIGEQVVDPWREDHYWTARQTLCLWPILGPDLPEAVRKFCRERLLLEEE